MELVQSLRNVVGTIAYHCQLRQERVFIISSCQSREGKSTIFASLFHEISSQFSVAGVTSMEFDGGDYPPVRMASWSVENPSVEITDEGEGKSMMVVTGPYADLGLQGMLLFRGMLDRLASAFDMVLIDGPPLGEQAWFENLSSMGCHLIMVVDMKRTKKTLLERTLTRIDRDRFNVLGGIVNRYHSPIPKVVLRGFGLEQFSK